MFYYYAYKLLALSSFLYHSSSPAADKQIFMFCILIKFSVKTTLLPELQSVITRYIYSQIELESILQDFLMFSHGSMYCILTLYTVV